ncbi:MAG TPA: cytochrome c [Blastocatellia bacterium]|nr:cytochrome c [Blastocatellia bacterium]
MEKMNFSTKEVKIVVVTAMTLLLVVLATPLQSSTQAAATLAPDGAATFKAKCAACHGVDGSGNTAAGKSMKVRDLRSAEVQSQSDDQLFSIIVKGKGKMPGYEKTLGADTCKALVAYTRKLGGR